MKSILSFGVLFLLICPYAYSPMYVEDDGAFIDRINNQKQLYIKDQSPEGSGFVYSHDEHWDADVSLVYDFVKDGKTIKLTGQTCLTFLNSLWRKNLCSARLLFDTFSNAIPRRYFDKWALSPNGDYLVALREAVYDESILDEDQPEILEQDAIYVYHFGTKMGEIKKLPGSMAYKKDGVGLQDSILLIAASSVAIAFATRKAIYIAKINDCGVKWYEVQNIESELEDDEAAYSFIAFRNDGMALAARRTQNYDKKAPSSSLLYDGFSTSIDGELPDSYEIYKFCGS